MGKSEKILRGYKDSWLVQIGKSVGVADKDSSAVCTE